MHALRSRSRHHGSSDSSEHLSRTRREENRPLEQRSSLDGFVIPGRTRYPSAKIPVPNPIDFHIAKSLLDSDLDNRSYGSIDAWQATRGSEFGGPYDQAVHNRNQSEQRIGSIHSTHGYVDGLYFTRLGSASGNSSRVTSDFVGWYNDLANQHGLRKIPGRNSSGAEPLISKEESEQGCHRSLLNRLFRKSHSCDSEDNSKSKLPRKQSVMSLLRHHHAKPSIACGSLNEITRLSGVSLVHLPPAYRAVSLMIPTCLAATANHLIDHGRECPGIFRIPGQASVVDILYDYYASIMQEAEDSPNVQAAIGASSLPSIACNTPDVASVFKRLLHDIPGGILGSLDLYHELEEINTMDVVQLNHSRESKSTKPRLIALALLSLQSESRLALICAVFGLLAYLKQDGAGNNAEIAACAMTSKALGVVFAPLLMGHLTEQINIDQGITQSPSPIRAKRGILGLRKTNKKDGEVSSMKLGIERVTAAAAVVEMLVQDWLPITKFIRGYNSLSPFGSVSATSCDLQNGRHKRHSLTSLNHVQARNSSYDRCGTLSRSISTSDVGPQTRSLDILDDSRRLSGTTRILSLSQLPPTEEEVAEEDMTTSVIRTASELPVLNVVASGSARAKICEVETVAWWEKPFKSSDVAEIPSVPEVEVLTIPESLGICAALSPSTPSQSLDDLFDSQYEALKGRLQGDSGPLEQDVSLGTFVMATEDHMSYAVVSSEGKHATTVPTSSPKTATAQKAHAHDIGPAIPRLPSSSSPSMIPRPVTDNGRARRSTTLSPPAASTAVRLPVLPHPASEPKAGKITPSALKPIELPAKIPESMPDPVKYPLRIQPHIPPLTNEPPIARRLHFKSSSERMQQSPSPEIISPPPQGGQKKPNVGLLYAEIGRLKRQLDTQSEENTQLRHELDTMRSLRTSGTLSEKLRTAEREVKIWKHRAEWAETVMMGKGERHGLEE